MIPFAFEYRCPDCVADLVALLSKYGESARVIAGGQSLIPAMKRRFVRPQVLLDLRRISELRRVEPTESGIRIGALVTHREVAASDLVRARCALLAEVAAALGDQQVRNLGTLVGALCLADPGADYPAVLVAAGAEVEIVGPRGSKKARVADFLQGASETALEPDEFVRAVVVPSCSGWSGAYAKQALGSSGFALAGVAALLEVADARLKSCRIGVTGVARRPFRAAGVEEKILEGDLGSDRIRNLVRGVTSGQDPLSDPYASPEYRAHLAEIDAARAIQRAAQRAGIRQ